MITVEDLRFAYSQDKELFDGLSFSINTGEPLVILGGNGVGKSTLLNILCGEIRNYSGTVVVDGQSVLNYSVKELSRIFAKVSSSSQVFQDLMVSDYLLTGFANRLGSFQMPSEEQSQMAVNVLNSLGVDELSNKSINCISAGEMQIVRIARALIQNPEIILLDEPTSNLDVKNQLMVISMIRDLSQKGYSVIVTSHNPGQAFEIGGKTLLLGKKNYYGEISRTISEESLKTIYESDVNLIDGRERQIINFSSTDNEINLYY